MPDYAVVKLEAIADIHAQAVTRAYEHGVTIAMGTDIGLTGPDRPNAWGQNGAEPGYLVKLGMTPLEAIEATTATGPLTLGPQAPRSGQLAEGYDADVIPWTPTRWPTSACSPTRTASPASGPGAAGSRAPPASSCPGACCLGADHRPATGVLRDLRRGG